MLGSALLSAQTCHFKYHTCQEYSFFVTGGNVTYLGKGDQHDSRYDTYKRVVNTSILQADDALRISESVVTFSFDVYPTLEMERQFVTRLPVVYACLIAGIFVGLSFTFAFYDYLVTNNQNRLTRMATKSSLIVGERMGACGCSGRRGCRGVVGGERERELRVAAE
jgi:hypothetical protein